MLSSWSKDNTRVALLVYYGTKLNEVLVFARNTSGAFEPVELSGPIRSPFGKGKTRRSGISDMRPAMAKTALVHGLVKTRFV